MARILTFLGKGGSGRTTLAVASALKLAQEGNRVLLVGQAPGPALSMLLGINPTSEPMEVAHNFQLVQLQTTSLLEKSWEDLKALEQQFLRSPTLKNVYGQELGILPGMDEALALNALRESTQSGKYDVIIYDGSDALSTLRMLGIPEILSWYLRRFRQVFNESDLGKTLSPFIQPVTSAIFNVPWNSESLSQNPNSQILEEGRAALGNPQRISAYLVVNNDPMAIAEARYLWGAAQQIGLTIAGLLLNQAASNQSLQEAFAPLPLTSIPSRTSPDWQILIDALPDFQAVTGLPKPLEIDANARQIKVFLPGFEKKEVKLSQSGSEITVEAGGQRRNIMLPAALAGQSVKGAKFQNGYLIISI